MILHQKSSFISRSLEKRIRYKPKKAYLHFGGERDYSNHRCKLKVSILEISLYPKSCWEPQKSNASHFPPAKSANFCANYNSSLWFPLEGLRAFYQYYWIKHRASNLQSERGKDPRERKLNTYTYTYIYVRRERRNGSWLFTLNIILLQRTGEPTLSFFHCAQYSGEDIPLQK